MSRVGFQPTTLVFEPGKTVNAADCAANVIGNGILFADLYSVAFPRLLIN
jgi:hypothetical protein